MEEECSSGAKAVVCSVLGCLQFSLLVYFLTFRFQHDVIARKALPGCWDHFQMPPRGPTNKSSFSLPVDEIPTGQQEHLKMQSGPVAWATELLPTKVRFSRGFSTPS